jgi:hypothetical protein
LDTQRKPPKPYQGLAQSKEKKPERRCANSTGFIEGGDVPQFGRPLLVFVNPGRSFIDGVGEFLKTTRQLRKLLGGSGARDSALAP